MAKLLELSDQEIIDIANPLWEDLIRTSNNKDYGGFTKNFSKKMEKHSKMVFVVWEGINCFEMSLNSCKHCTWIFSYRSDFPIF